MIRSSHIKSPEVSVLMSCYNASRWLNEAIESVLAQTFEAFEFILVDDGSTDETWKIIQSYYGRDERIVAISKTNTGLTDSLNVGLKAAKGIWIARMDADDLAMTDRFEKQMNVLKNNIEIKVLGTGCIAIDATGNEIREYRYPESHNAIVRQMEKCGSPFPHSSVIFLREAATQIGGYRNRFNGAEDVDLWLRLSSIGKLKCLQIPLIKLRKHNESITGSQSLERNRRLMVLSVTARVSHYLRKIGYHDPASATEEEYRQFLNWVGEQLENRSEFQKQEMRELVRQTLYSGANKAFIMRIISVLWISDLFKYWRSILIDKIIDSNIAQDIAYSWSKRIGNVENV